MPTPIGIVSDCCSYGGRGHWLAPVHSGMPQELLTLQKTLRKTIVIITHNLHEALTLGSHVAIMKDGRFVQVGRPQYIIEAPADDYVASFTRDIDRARVLTAQDVMGSPVILSADDPIARARESVGALAFVIDHAGRPFGLLLLPVPAAVAGEAAVASRMNTGFSRATSDTRLPELYGMCAAGLPIAIVDAAGRLLGAVQPLDGFRALMSPGARGQSGG